MNKVEFFRNFFNSGKDQSIEIPNQLLILMSKSPIKDFDIFIVGNEMFIDVFFENGDSLQFTVYCFPEDLESYVQLYGMEGFDYKADVVYYYEGAEYEIQIADVDEWITRYAFANIFKWELNC